jgi:hypothetical protein
MPPKKHYIRIRIPAWCCEHRGKAFWVRFALLGIATGVSMLIGVWYHEVAHISYALIATRGIELIGEAASESIAEDV